MGNERDPVSTTTHALTTLAPSSDEQSNFFASSQDPLWHSVAFGTVSGVSAVVIGHPLDSIKVVSAPLHGL